MREWVGMMGGAVVMVSCSRVVWSERHKDGAVADVRLEGNALEQTVRCHHNAIHVLGNESRLTFVGSCTKVYVEGNRNWMKVQDAGVIETRGFMNSVLYLNPEYAHGGQGEGELRDAEVAAVGWVGETGWGLPDADRGLPAGGKDIGLL